MKHFLTKTIAASTAAAPLAHGAIVVTDVNETIGIAENSSETLFVDFSAGAFSPTQDGHDISLFFAFSNSEKPSLNILNTSYAVAIPHDTFNLVRYNFGDSIDASYSSNSNAFFYFANENNNSGNWINDVGGSSGYVALQNTSTSKEIWIEIDYDDEADTLDVIRFAYADASDNITAGQVPEPAQSAALMALLAGSAALFSRRGKRSS